MGGSSRRQTVGYRYYVGVHAILCRGPVDGILRITFDTDKPVFTGYQQDGVISVDLPELFGGTSREGGVQGDIAVQLGSSSQTLDSYLLEQNGAIQPSYRNVVGFILRHLYIGLNPYLKKWGATLQRVYVRQNGLEQWYPETAGILNAQGPISDVLWLLNFNGAHGATSCVDTSAYARAVTVSNLVQSTVSARFGTTGMTTVDAVNSTMLSSSSVAYPWTPSQGLTLEAWVRATALSEDGWTFAGVELRTAGGGGAGAIAYGIADETSPDRNWWFISLFGGGLWFNPLANPDYQLSTGPYVHTALDYNGDTGIATMYINGISVGTFTATPTAAVSIGTVYGFGRTTAGGSTAGAHHMDGIRITAGRRRYTGNFTPPTSAPFDDGPQILGNYYDMNPAHAIREALTDPDWGAGNPDSEIDDASFEACADVLYAEQMGISYLWRVSSSIEEFIRLICKHIDATVYVDPVTGKFVMKLIRDDYDPETLLELNPSNILKVTDFGRTTFNELVNTVVGTYWDARQGKDASLTLSDIALVAIQQAQVSEGVDYPAFTNSRNATKALQRDLRAMSTPRISCILEATDVAKDLRIGECFVLSWPEFQISSVVMRVTGLAFGDGKKSRVRISCIQDVFGISSVVMLAPPVLVTPPSNTPIAVANRLLIEMPYLELVQRYSQSTVDSDLAAMPEEGLFAVAAVRPQTSAINARVLVDSGSGYEDSATADFCSTAILAGPVAIDATVIELDAAIEMDEVTDGSWVQIDNELMVAVSYAAPNLTVKRGALDTVPMAHAAGARLYFWDAIAATDEVKYLDGVTIDVKLCTVTGGGQLSELSAPIDSLEFSSRAIRPYPPAQVQINSEYYPEVATGSLTVTWVHRDRLQQTGGSILGFMDGGVGPEAGTTYNLRVYDDVTDTLLASDLGVSGTSSTVSPAFTGTIRIELGSVRGGYDSFQNHVWVMELTQAAALSAEDGAALFTETGNAFEEE